MCPPDDIFLRENRIDFISAYCDRWCERCPFTSRCSAYAVHVATAMCGGDFKAGLELAVGEPPPATASVSTTDADPAPPVSDRRTDPGVAR